MGADFNGNMETLFGSLDKFVNTKTVVGEPIQFNDTIMLPLVDVAFGVGAGAINTQDKANKGQDLGGLGAKITPSAVVVIRNDTVQLVNVKNQDALSKIIDMAPGLLAKLNINLGDNKENEPKDSTVKKETVKKETVTETIITDEE